MAFLDDSIIEKLKLAENLKLAGEVDACKFLCLKIVKNYARWNSFDALEVFYGAQIYLKESDIYLPKANVTLSSADVLLENTSDDISDGYSYIKIDGVADAINYLYMSAICKQVLDVLATKRSYSSSVSPWANKIANGNINNKIKNFFTWLSKSNKSIGVDTTRDESILKGFFNLLKKGEVEVNVSLNIARLQPIDVIIAVANGQLMLEGESIVYAN